MHHFAFIVSSQSLTPGFLSIKGSVHLKSVLTSSSETNSHLQHSGKH